MTANMAYLLLVTALKGELQQYTAPAASTAAG